MATNRPTTRRRSVKTAFDDDDAPVAKRAKTEVNAASKRTNGATKKAVKAGEFELGCGGLAGLRREMRARANRVLVVRFEGAKADGVVAYDENDDGFQFTRRTSRRTTKAQPPPEPIPEEPPKPAPARKKKNSIATPEPTQAAPQKRRRSARLSGDGHELTQVDGPPDAAKPAPKRTKKSAPGEKEKGKQVTPAPEPQQEEKSAFVGLQTPKQNGLHVAKKRDGATKIMLPFADTPVITRNKEMRKGSKEGGHRRSSTGLRGRRASSLIDSGMSNGECGLWLLRSAEHCEKRGSTDEVAALPHSEVEVRNFFKYIEQSLPEPRRMKQLLTWCGSRALPDKPSGDVKNVNAIMAGEFTGTLGRKTTRTDTVTARAIQQELIEELSNKPELSDWFSRVCERLPTSGKHLLICQQEDTAPPPVIKKPNPQNDKNQATLEELEEEVKRYAYPCSKNYVTK